MDYVRVIDPSSMDREVKAGEDREMREKVWEGADYQLSFAFILLQLLELGNDKLCYQEEKAIQPEIGMLKRRGVKVLEGDERSLQSIPKSLSHDDNNSKRIVLFVPGGGF